MKTEFNGVFWWDLRNGQDAANNNSSSLYGWRQYGDYAIVPGADGAGLVDAVGSGVSGLSPGERVLVQPGLYCNECEFCRGGEQSLCVKFGIVEHAGKKENDYPIILTNDDELRSYVASLEGKPVHKGVQAEYLDWASCFSKEAVAELDYVLSDAMTIRGRDGATAAAHLAQPSGIATDGRKLYFADSETSSIREAGFGEGARVETIVGRGLFEFGDIDGDIAVARFQHPLGIAVRNGLIYVADTYNNRIKVIDPMKRNVTTLAGTSRRGLVDGLLQDAAFNEPGGLAWLGEAADVVNLVKQHQAEHFADAGNRAKAGIVQGGDGLRPRGDRFSGRAIRADLECVVASDFEQVGDLRQHPRDLCVIHARVRAARR